MTVTTARESQLEKDFVFYNDVSCGSFPTWHRAFTIIFGASVICLATFDCIIQLCPWSAVSGAAGSHMAGRKIYSFTVASGVLKTQGHDDKQDFLALELGRGCLIMWRFSEIVAALVS